MRHLKRTVLRTLAVLPLFLFAQNSWAGSDDIAYTMRAGDNLISLSAKYLKRAGDYHLVQKYNSITDPFHIPVGRVISFPRRLLKYRPAGAKLLAVRGRVTINAAEQAEAGQMLREGARLATAEASFATLLLDNGSRVSIPSNSDIKISLLRTYMLGGSLDYDFDVDRGGVRSAVNSLKSPDDRYRVRTPKAVSAVRGTDFQSRYDPSTNADFAEVVEGGLAVGIVGSEGIPLPAGNGLAVPATGKVLVEKLLPPPALVTASKLQADPELTFAAMPNQNMSGLRYSIATDAGFVDQIADIVTTSNDAKFANIGNGNYFVRARAISAAGIEGIPATYAFKRRLNAVNASAARGDEGYVFRWFGQSGGVTRYHFQLYKGPITGTALVDEASLDGDRVILSDLLPGEYQWRVGSVQYADGEVATNWTEFEKLSVGAP